MFCGPWVDDDFLQGITIEYGNQAIEVAVIVKTGTDLERKPRLHFACYLGEKGIEPVSLGQQPRTFVFFGAGGHRATEVEIDGLIAQIKERARHLEKVVGVAGQNLRVNGQQLVVLWEKIEQLAWAAPPALDRFDKGRYREIKSAKNSHECGAEYPIGDAENRG